MLGRFLPDGVGIANEDMFPFRQYHKMLAESFRTNKAITNIIIFIIIIFR